MDKQQTTKCTLNEYLLEEKEFSHQAQATIIKALYKAKIKAILVGEHYGYSDGYATKRAHGIIEGGECLYNNADVDEVDGDDDDEECDEVNQLGEECSEVLSDDQGQICGSGLFSTTFLLIRAPSSVRRPMKDIDKDDEARRWQYDHFCELHPALEAGSPCSERVDCSVRSYEEMVHCTKDYFKQYAASSIQAVVVFNGHGGPNGLSLEHETIPLDRFLTDVKDLLGRYRSELGLPMRVKVIYAQCYGHLYTNFDAGCDISVVSMTNEAMKTTQFTIQKDLLTKACVNSRHVMLDQYAREEKKTYDVEKEKALLEEKEKEREANCRRALEQRLEDTVDTNMDTTSVERIASSASFSERLTTSSSLGTELDNTCIESQMELLNLGRKSSLCRADPENTTESPLFSIGEGDKEDTLYFKCPSSIIPSGDCSSIGRQCAGYEKSQTLQLPQLRSTTT